MACGEYQRLGMHRPGTHIPQIQSDGACMTRRKGLAAFDDKLPPRYRHAGALIRLKPNSGPVLGGHSPASSTPKLQPTSNQQFPRTDSSIPMRWIILKVARPRSVAQHDRPPLGGSCQIACLESFLESSWFLSPMGASLRSAPLPAVRPLGDGSQIPPQAPVRYKDQLSPPVLLPRVSPTSSLDPPSP